ncbi:MAG: hypothetical protein ABIQ87_10395 [Rubrivivax sp.]
MLEPVLFTLALGATLLALNSYLNQGAMQQPSPSIGQQAPGIGELAVATAR